MNKKSSVSALSGWQFSLIYFVIASIVLAPFLAVANDKEPPPAPRFEQVQNDPDYVKGVEAARGLSGESTEDEVNSRLRDLNVTQDPQMADAWGILDSSLFELHTHGKPSELISLTEKYGELGDRLLLVVSKKRGDLKVELVKNPSTSRTEAHIVFDRGGLFSRFKGSRMIVGRQFRNYASSADDENLIALLDKSGSLQIIDRRMLRFQFGKSGTPTLTVERYKLDPNYDYEVRFKKGTLSEMGLSPTNQNGGFRVNGRLIEDLKQNEKLLVEDGGLFLYRRPKDNSEAVEIVDFVSREEILKRATTQLLALVGIGEDLNALNRNDERRLQSALLQIGDQVENYLKANPDLFKQAELAEIQRSLSALDMNSLMDEVDSLRGQASAAKASNAHSLIEWITSISPLQEISEESAPDTKFCASLKSACSNLKQTRAWKTIVELFRKTIQPSSLVTYGLIAAAVSAPLLYTSATPIISKLAPMPLDDAYRPILWRSMVSQTGFFYAILAGMGVIAYSMRKSISYTVTLLGMRLYGLLAFPPTYVLSKAVGGNAVFAGKAGVWPTFENGGLQMPLASRENRAEAQMRIRTTVQQKARQRALSRLVAYAAVAAEENVSFSQMNLLRLRLALAKKMRAEAAQDQAKLHELAVQALKSGSPEDVFLSEFEIRENAQQQIISDRDRLDDLFTETALISAKMDRFLVDSRNEGVTPDTALISAYKEEARELLRAHREKSFAGRLLQKGILFLKAFPEKLTTTFWTFGLDLFRSSLFRAEPSEVVAQQNVSTSIADIVGTQVPLYYLWSGAPVNGLVERALNGGRFIDEKLAPEKHPEFFDEKGEVTYQFLASRADPRQPNSLAAQEDGFLYTHPQLVGSLSQQFYIFWSVSAARMYFEYGGAKGITNEYAKVSEEEVPAHEKYQPWYKTLSGFFKTVFHARKAGYEYVLTQKWKNFFRFIQPAVISGLIFQVGIAGANVADLPLQLLFGFSVGMWAFGWLWLPINGGFNALGMDLEARYAEFVSARSQLEVALRARNIDESLKAAENLAFIYRQNKQELTSWTAYVKNFGAVPEADLNADAEKYLGELEGVLRESQKHPATFQKVHEGVQNVINYLMGGLITTALAIPIDVWMYDWGTKDKFEWSLVGLALYGISIYGFKAGRHLMEKAGDALLRKRSALKGSGEYIKNYSVNAERLAHSLAGTVPGFKADEVHARIKEQAESLKDQGVCRRALGKIRKMLSAK